MKGYYKCSLCTTRLCDKCRLEVMQELKMKESESSGGESS
jgi:hypothetical protein